MRVGIGVTTYGRSDHLDFWVKQIKANTPETNVSVHIANDNRDRKGIAFRKTECIRELLNEGCDYFFLFDSDCFPIKTGWMHFFIEASQVSGQHHFMYLHETPGVKLLQSMDGPVNSMHVPPRQVRIDSYDNCNGCMLFFTREVVDKVGGFNKEFGFYGLEHGEYTNRIHAAGLTPMGKYLCPVGASEYIYSLDIDHHIPEWHKMLKHKSSMTPKEALFHASKAQEVYNKPSPLKHPL